MRKNKKKNLVPVSVQEVNKVLEQTYDVQYQVLKKVLTGRLPWIDFFKSPVYYIEKDLPLEQASIPIYTVPRTRFGQLLESLLWIYYGNKYNIENPSADSSMTVFGGQDAQDILSHIMFPRTNSMSKWLFGDPIMVIQMIAQSLEGVSSGLGGLLEYSYQGSPPLRSVPAYFRQASKNSPISFIIVRVDMPVTRKGLQKRIGSYVHEIRHFLEYQIQEKFMGGDAILSGVFDKILNLQYTRLNEVENSLFKILKFSPTDRALLELYNYIGRMPLKLALTVAPKPEKLLRIVFASIQPDIMKGRKDFALLRKTPKRASFVEDNIEADLMVIDLVYSLSKKIGNMGWPLPEFEWPNKGKGYIDLVNITVQGSDDEKSGLSFYKKLLENYTGGQRYAFLKKVEKIIVLGLEVAKARWTILQKLQELQERDDVLPLPRTQLSLPWLAMRGEAGTMMGDLEIELYDLFTTVRKGERVLSPKGKRFMKEISCHKFLKDKSKMKVKTEIRNKHYMRDSVSYILLNYLGETKRGSQIASTYGVMLEAKDEDSRVELPKEYERQYLRAITTVHEMYYRLRDEFGRIKEAECFKEDKK